MPRIVNAPGLVPEGRECDDLIDAADILPTLAELAGAELPAGVEFTRTIRERPSFATR